MKGEGERERGGRERVRRINEGRGRERVGEEREEE